MTLIACETCGREISAAAKFCAGCGTQRVPVVAAVPAPVQPAPAEPAQAVTQPEAVWVGDPGEPRVHSGGYAHGVDTGLAGRVDPASLMAFAIRAGMVGAACGAPFLILWIVLAALGHGGSGLGGLAVIVFLLAGLASLFIPFREPISSWWALVDNRAGAADSAYSAIYASLRSRQYPCVATPRRIRNEFSAGQARNYLVVNEGKYVAYVSVFGYGTGLYMSWTMWRRQYPFLMFFTFFKQIVDTVSGRGTLFHLILRAEVVQAFREGLHAAVQEGLDVAMANTPVSIASTFGHNVPVESIAGASGVPTPPIPSLPRQAPTVPPSAARSAQ